MKKPLQRLLAGITLTITALTGYTLINELIATTNDTAWGAPAPSPVTLLDTAWGE